MQRLDPRFTALLVIDVQVRLAAAMATNALEQLVANSIVLLEAAHLLGVRIVATEQYPKGLGSTVEPIAARLRAMGVTPFDKTTFDASADPRVARVLSEGSVRSVVLVGLEAHVCVFQTARELGRRGMEVYVAADAVASRREENRALGLSLCERAGAFAAPTESVIFDWLERGGTEEFRTLSKLLR